MPLRKGFLDPAAVARWIDRSTSVRSHGVNGAEAHATGRPVPPEVNSGESPGHFPERLASTRLTLPGGRILSANLVPVQAASTRFGESTSHLIFLLKV